MATSHRQSAKFDGASGYSRLIGVDIAGPESRIFLTPTTEINSDRVRSSCRLSARRSESPMQLRVLLMWPLTLCGIMEIIKTGMWGAAFFVGSNDSTPSNLATRYHPD
jgi:hypothetical protein